MTDEEVAANKDKRPLFQKGDRVEVTTDGQFKGWRGVVWDISAVQTAGGVVVSYLYRLDMENLAQHRWHEENLRLVTNTEES
jgi:transcription antitermination factor NusG